MQRPAAVGGPLLPSFFFSSSTQRLRFPAIQETTGQSSQNTETQHSSSILNPLFLSLSTEYYLYLTLNPTGIIIETPRHSTPLYEALVSLQVSGLSNPSISSKHPSSLPSSALSAPHHPCFLTVSTCWKEVQVPIVVLAVGALGSQPHQADSTPLAFLSALSPSLEYSAPPSFYAFCFTLFSRPTASYPKSVTVWFRVFDPSTRISRPPTWKKRRRRCIL